MRPAKPGHDLVRDQQGAVRSRDFRDPAQPGFRLGNHSGRTLQQRFRAEADKLRAMDPGSRKGAMKAFAENEAGQGIRAPEGTTGPGHVDFTARGDNFAVGTEGRAPSQAYLCEFSDSTVLDLGRARAGAKCQGIADAIEAHERSHQARCQAVGYVPYRDTDPADRAMEEVSAYEAQAQALRAAIRAVLADASITLRVTSEIHMEGPARNPLYTGVDIHNDVTVRTTPAGAAPASTAEIAFEGSAEQVSDPKVLGGNCTMEGTPFRVPGRGRVLTDGETAKVSFILQGRSPSFGMRCRVPGMKGSGSGMSLPSPVGPSSGQTGDMPLALEDGAHVRFEAKDSPAAAIMAKAGASLSGFTDAEIRLECPAPK